MAGTRRTPGKEQRPEGVCRKREDHWRMGWYRVQWRRRWPPSGGCDVVLNQWAPGHGGHREGRQKIKRRPKLGILRYGSGNFVVVFLGRTVLAREGQREQIYKRILETGTRVIVCAGSRCLPARMDGWMGNQTPSTFPVDNV